MPVKHNHVITLHYQLKDDNDEILDKSYDSQEPMVYLHGHRQMIRGFEAAIAGAEEGEKRAFSVSPAEATVCATSIICSAFPQNTSSMKANYQPVRRLTLIPKMVLSREPSLSWASSMLMWI